MNTVQEVFLKFYPEYKEKYRLSREQYKAAQAIMNCRTSKLGGHAYSCHTCGHYQVSYNSCRNRHCSMCQGVNKEVWVDKRKKDILNAPYFHVVFTMPEQLHMVIYHNQKLLYDLMYKAVAETLSELSLDPKYLGTQIGQFSVLHTWGQIFRYSHIFPWVPIAVIITSAMRCFASSISFFTLVIVSIKTYLRKYLYYLIQYYNSGFIDFYNDGEQYKNPSTFQSLIDAC